MATLNVTGAVVTKIGVTIYTADGGVRSLSQEDYRTADVLAKVTLGLTKDGFAEIELNDFSLKEKIEKATNGAVTIEEAANGSLALVAGDVKIETGTALNTVLQHAAEGVGAVGLPKFIQNFAEIRRQHSQKELLEFIERHKLPIADDGTIIVFKRLRSARNAKDEVEEGYYVDSHTGKVKQRVGSIVLMPEGRVDPNRNNQCSSGFHVASEEYIPSFSGDKLIICKVKPQHVISVPRDYNFSKMRVSEYTIVAEVPSEMASRLFSRGRFNDNEESAAFLGRIVAGHHAAPVEFVEEFKPGETKVTPIERADRKSLAPMKTAAKLVQDIPETKKASRVISPKEVRETVKTIKEKGEKGLKGFTDKAKEYAEKLKKAKKLWKGGNGKSIREIARTLGMDRDSLTKHLKQS